MGTFLLYWLIAFVGCLVIVGVFALGAFIGLAIHKRLAIIKLDPTTYWVVVCAIVSFCLALGKIS